MVNYNLTYPISDDVEWNSLPAWKLPGWAEPIMVVTVLFTGMFVTRRKGYSIFNRNKDSGYLDRSPSDESTHGLLYRDSSDSDEDNTPYTRRPKVRDCCCMKVTTPDTSRFKNNIHSRLFQRFPFLNEMLYWVINYAFYRFTSIASQWYFGSTGIWDVAQNHGLGVLAEEEYGFFAFLFPIHERSVQQWFMHGHQGALTVLNKAYALIHIPGTVGFICWYYWAAPSFDTFATVRRTMTLTNFIAFLTFICYPTMPPRLLPREYGFLDTVRHDDAESVWMSGKFVNTLAAMPSMHFGYSFCIGMTLIYHSGLFRRTLEKGEPRKSAFWKLFYLICGLGYPTFLLITIVATANHYFMDALIASLLVITSFFCNKIFYVFIPLEDYFLYLIRADKPVPTTGQRY